MKAPQELSTEAIERIAASIPEGASTYRIGLLPKVLRSWSDEDLLFYDAYAERDIPARRREPRRSHASRTSG